MNWIDVGALEDIPLRGARTLKTNLGCVALFRTGANEVFAATNTCPHKAGPLSEGIIHGKKVTCPLHNWVFDLETGLADGENGALLTFPVKIEAGRVLVPDTLAQEDAA